jgi:hypothetical protein
MCYVKYTWSLKSNPPQDSHVAHVAPQCEAGLGVYLLVKLVPCVAQHSHVVHAAVAAPQREADLRVPLTAQLLVEIFDFLRRHMATIAVREICVCVRAHDNALCVLCCGLYVLYALYFLRRHMTLVTVRDVCVSVCARVRMHSGTLW